MFAFVCLCRARNIIILARTYFNAEVGFEGRCCFTAIAIAVGGTPEAKRSLFFLSFFYVPSFTIAPPPVTAFVIFIIITTWKVARRQRDLTADSRKSVVVV